MNSHHGGSEIPFTSLQEENFLHIVYGDGREGFTAVGVGQLGSGIILKSLVPSADMILHYKCSIQW